MGTLRKIDEPLGLGSQEYWVEPLGTMITRLTREQMIDEAVRRVFTNFPFGDPRCLFMEPGAYKLSLRGSVWRRFAPAVRAEFRRLAAA